MRVWVTIAGEVDRKYAGLYWLVENVDTNFIQARFKTKDGPILKPVSVNPFNDLGNDWAKYIQTYDPKTETIAKASDNKAQANALIQREYRKGYELPYKG